MANTALTSFLLGLRKDPKPTGVFFLIPSGLISGNFEDFDHVQKIVKISDFSIAETKSNTSIDISVEDICGWGRK